MKCTLANNGEPLQGLRVTVTLEQRDSFTEKMSEKYENGSTMTQKEVIKWRAHLETMEKR